MVKKAIVALPMLFAGIAAAQSEGNWTLQFPSKAPSLSGGYSMTYDSAHGQVVLFGGSEYSEIQFNDTWTWDGSNWTQQSPRNSPPTRTSPATGYDSLHGQVVLFGGIDGISFLGGTFLNDTWTWDGSNWTKKSPQNSPPARILHIMAYDSAHGQVVLFGGRDQGGCLLGDTWIWDGSNWTQKFPQNSPSARHSHAMAYDSARGEMVLFEGFSFSGGNYG
jgi:hypothetical protein